MKICTLASGSKGNCILVEGGGTKVLVDAGLTLKQTKLRLSQIDVRPDEISAIIVTHEHSDHVKGIGPIGRAWRIPVYMTPKTRAASVEYIGPGVNYREFEAGSAFDVMDLRFEPFSTPHDAADPVGFAFYCGGMKGGLATDLGYASRLVVERLKGANVLVLESNHDPVMLKTGPYPWHLKQRVAGREGHLSNEDAGGLLRELLHPGMSRVVLAHLSQVNNLPEIAYKKASEAVCGACPDGLKIAVAGQDSVSGYVGG